MPRHDACSLAVDPNDLDSVGRSRDLSVNVQEW